MKLEEFIKSKKIKKVTFAKKVGISKGYLTQLCKRTHQPSLEVALRIVEATEGEVTAVDLTKEREAA